MPSVGAIFTEVSFFTPAATVTDANEGLSLTGTIVKLGQSVGAAGNPAALASNREIPMQGFFISMPTNAASALIKFPAISAGLPETDFFISHNSVAFPGGNDEVINLGFNASPSFTPIVAGRPVFGISMEGSFSPLPGDFTQEFHIIQVKPAGTQVRILSLTADANTNNIDAFFSCNSFEWKSSDGAGNVWANFTGGGSAAVTFRLRGIGGTEMQLAYTEVAGTATAGISTTAAGATEFHLDTWALVTLPAMTSAPSINIFSAQVLPSADNTITIGNQVSRYSFVNSVLGRISNGLLIGDYSANQTPEASLHISNVSNGSVNSEPIKLPNAGTLLTVPENGAIETDGTSIFYTSGGTRATIFTGNDAAAAPGTTAGIAIGNFYGTAATNYLGDPNSWTQVIINGTSYKIPLYT